MKNLLCFGLMLLLFVCCSNVTLIDQTVQEEIKTLTGCDRVLTGTKSAYDSRLGAIKTMIITIQDPTELDILDKDQVESASLEVAAVIFDEVEKIDTSFTNFTFNFVAGESEYEVDYPKDELFAQLGFHFFHAGDQKKGIAYFDRAIDSNPIMKHYNNRASLYFELKRYDEALADIQKALTFEPDSPERLRAVAAVYLEMKDFSKTREIIEQAISRDPEFGNAYAVRARLFKRTNKADSAITDFEKAISLNPTVGKWTKELSELYFEANKADNALDAIDNYLANAPEDGQAHLLKGKILLQLKKKAEACESFLNASKLGEKDSVTFVNECNGV